MTTPSRQSVTIYTDGGCVGNPGPGGYGVVLFSGSHRRELSGAFRLTTNNRMELFAAISGLDALKSPCDVLLYSDSTYLVSAMQKGTPQRWRENGWRRKGKGAGEAVKNPDLWKNLLDAEALHEVSYLWVKGHANVAENERCDRLAVAAATGRTHAVDEVFEREHPELQDRVKAAGRRPVAGAGKKVTHAGQSCPKCGGAVEQRKPKRGPKPGQAYYYAYYFTCPDCGTNYMVEEAKRQT